MTTLPVNFLLVANPDITSVLKNRANALLHFLQVLRFYNHAAPVCRMRLAAYVARTLQAVHDAGDSSGTLPLLKQNIGAEPSLLGCTLVVHKAGHPAAMGKAVRQQI